MGPFAQIKGLDAQKAGLTKKRQRIEFESHFSKSNLKKVKRNQTQEQPPRQQPSVRLFFKPDPVKISC